MIAVSSLGVDPPETQDVGAFYDAIAPEYDHHFQTEFSKAEDLVVFSRLRAFDGADVVDLGCGTGLYLENCRPAAYLGVDVARGMLNEANRKFPQRLFQHGRMEHVQASADAFTLAISLFGSFSYSLHPAAALSEMYRLLAPGGRLYLMAFSERYRCRPSHIAGNTIPFTTWTARSLSEAVMAAGFAPDSITIRALNWLGEPYLARVPARLLARWYGVERWLLGARLAHWGYFLTLEALKLRAAPSG